MRHHLELEPAATTTSCAWRHRPRGGAPPPRRPKRLRVVSICVAEHLTGRAAQACGECGAIRRGRERRRRRGREGTWPGARLKRVVNAVRVRVKGEGEGDV